MEDERIQTRQREGKMDVYNLLKEMKEKNASDLHIISGIAPIFRIAGQLRLQTGAQFGMQTMDQTLKNLVKRGLISFETALSRARDPKGFQESLS